MARQFPTYILNEEGFLIRTIFPKFIAHIPNDHPVTEEMKVLQWWDDADDKKKEQTIHHAKKWFVYSDDNRDSRNGVRIEWAIKDELKKINKEKLNK